MLQVTHSVYQCNSAPAQPCQVPQKFSEEMGVKQLSQWLSNHPKIGSEYQAEINIFKGTYIENFVTMYSNFNMTCD